jgi:hypothetical protein
MPTYPVINTETGEQKEVKLTLDEWEDFKSQNSDWIRDWSDPSTAPASCETGEMQDKILKAHPSWGEVLKKVKKSGGSKSQIQL